MLPRKRNVPAEPAANPFALSRPQQISVSDEITAVKQAPPSLVPPPLPSRAAGAASSRRLAAARVAPPPRVGPPPIPRELPRASFIPPSPEDFERASSRDGFPAVKESAPISAKPNSSDTIEPMAITHHPPALAAGAGQRPSASWAMALLALGVFGGVVTAIIAGGDTETILRAGAKFIDPTGAQPPVAAAVVPLQAPSTTVPAYEPPRAAAPAPVAAAEERAAEKREAKAEPKPEPKADAREKAALIAAIEPIRSAKVDKSDAKPQPKAEVKPAPKVAWTPPPRRAEPPAPKPAADPKPAPAPKSASAPSAEEELAQATPKKRGKDDAAAAAAAANALAKAQLEGSL